MYNQPVPASGRPILGLLACVLLGLCILISLPGAHAAESGGATESAPAPDANAETVEKDKDRDEDKKKAVKAYYKDGLHIASEDGNFLAKINWRLQLRLTDLESADLVGEEDGVEEESGFLIRRARFKLKGHAYRPWLGYYLEYGIAGNILLTWQLDLAKWEKFSVRTGQFKVPYNRERVDSSGRLQFVDRSIVNNPFTVDRQQGISLLGHLFKGTRGDSKYAAGVYTGTGRGGDLDGDKRPMYVGRWQWNFLKRDLGYAQSDIKMRPKPAASLAVAGSSNVSQYTRFSSGGGGQLPGFEPGVIGQYKLEQWMAEFAYQGRGLSIQSEFHRKRINDRVNLTETDLEGFYGQVGYFFHGLFDKFPRKLELAARYARVKTVDGIEIPADREKSLVLNWFFHGHNNKLTMDYSQLTNTLPGGSEDKGWRVRAQWDITF